MAIKEPLGRLWTSLAALGTQRLVILAGIGLAVFLTVAGGAFYLSRPSLETLYTGLNRDDIGRMGSVLRDADIPFDVSSDGASLLVSYGKTAQARMLLAAKGLPQSANSGYELFNDLGSLGLTSFMQEVTRIRALEGELARTIQLMKGVKSARVHIVLGDRSSFRRETQAPSASVVIRTEPADDTSSAQAIRHMVSSSIPGLKTDRVTVMNTEGALLASGEDSLMAATGAMAKFEKGVSEDIQGSVRRTLAPYLGIGNFEVSVAARLNTDKVQTSETVFDPDSRIERSVRTVRETENSQNRQGSKPTTVQQNLPNQDVNAEGGDNTNSESQRREETTNFEMSSKTTQTVRDGYSIKNLSVAVLVNRGRLTELLGDQATPADIDNRVTEIEQLVASAAGFDKARGDQLKVAAVAFTNTIDAMPPVAAPTFFETISRQFSSILNAGVILLVSVLMILFGLRPAVKMLLARNEAEVTRERTMANLAITDEPVDVQTTDANANLLTAPNTSPGIVINMKESASAQRKLEHVVAMNEEKAAAVLRKWLTSDAA